MAFRSDLLLDWENPKDNFEIDNNTATILLYANNFRIGRIYIAKPHSVSTLEYESMNIPGYHGLIYEDPFGYVTISSNDGITKFSACTHGIDGLGEVIISFPSDVCTHIFEKLAAWRRKIDALRDPNRTNNDILSVRKLL